MFKLAGEKAGHLYRGLSSFTRLSIVLYKVSMMKRYRTAADRIVYIMHREDWTPFYVGKGEQRRPGDHIKEAENTDKNTHKLNIIRQMGRKLVRERTVILARGLTNTEACAMEILLIAAIGRADKGLGPLVNLTDGGEGGLRGFKHSEQSRAKMRKTLADLNVKARQSANIKAAFSDPDVRARCQAAAKIGLKKTGVKDKQLASMRNTMATQEYKEKQSNSQKIRWADPEKREQQRLVTVSNWSDPDIRQRRLNNQKLALSTPEARERKRIASTGRKASQETIAKLKEAWTHRAPVSKEARAKMRAAKLGRKRSPEAIAKMHDTFERKKLERCASAR